jgi:hypothetical protein
MSKRGKCFREKLLTFGLFSLALALEVSVAGFDSAPDVLEERLEKRHTLTMFLTAKINM